MALDIPYVNNYGYLMENNSSSRDNIKLVSDNSAQKAANTPEKVIEQNIVSTNSALLFEYTQNIAKTNIAQQLVLDANLKETLKFLNSEAAKRMSQMPKKKFGSIVEQIFTDNDVEDYKSNEQDREAEAAELMDLFGIEIDTSKENIFAA
jgi:hypothetical protein